MSAAGTTFESKEPLLSELLKEIGEGKVQLPDFQRPWRWDDVHIRSLIASVSLAYPVGAVMLLEAGGVDVRFKPRLVHGVDLRDPRGPDRLILDGQQRLTSLFGALFSNKPVDTTDEKGKAITRWYYLDIALCLDPEADRMDAVVSLPPDRMVRSDFGRKVDLDASSREKEYELGLIPATILLDPVRFMEWQQGFQRHFGYGDVDRTAQINAFASDVWMLFQKFKVPVIQLKKETPKEAVCQVFEKVNTGGVALTVFELMTATYAADDFRLVEDWTARRQRLHKHDVLRKVGGTEFLQAVTLLAGWRRQEAGGAAMSAKRKDVLRLLLSDYKACADAVEAGFLRSARLLMGMRVLDERNLPYGTQLVPLAAACGEIGARFEEVSVRQKLTQWYWCGVFGELYGGANETRYGMDVNDLCRWVLDGGVEPRTVRTATFSPLRLLSLQTRGSAAYKGLMALMVQAGSLDFMNGDPIADTQGFQLPVDIHHIFPESWSQGADLPREKWNSAINKAPLTKRTNVILQGDAPSAYLARLVRKGAIDDGRLEDVLRTHYIDPALLRSDDFHGFLRDRAIRLLDAIEGVTGKPISGRDAEDVIEVFGAPLVREAAVD